MAKKKTEATAETEAKKTEEVKAETKTKKTEVEKKVKAEKMTAPKTGNGGVALAVTLASVAVVLSGASAVFSYLSYEKASTPLTILNSDGTDGNTVSFVEGTVADIVDKVSESVVSIVTSVTTTSYFGQSYISEAAGTGIIVSSDGYVLTNKHVIDGAKTINVVLDDGTTYKNVEVAAVDPLNDVAFLKIKDVSDLKAAKLGDSKTITVGQQVIAIGNALGQYQNSVTSGIVSGTGRSLTATDSTGTMSEQLSDMIQTDAAINSGNSGGPLVNAAGEVIGINTATTSAAENMGFAIPIASVKGMLAQLKESGEAKRAYLGVYVVEITPEVAKSYNLPVSEGVYVYSSSSYSAVIKDSPAAKAGLKDKDIITAVNGVKIGSNGSLSTLIGEYKPSDTVQLTVIRDGKEIAVNVTLDGYAEK
ncbi:trypsin-like peptidase domain-containing protein [Candidatus Saccharibacteria bacterium]|nr:trypsin-like peptidase domain-containing protein [Candidatus Saccharibacteria bacterium]